VTDASVYSRARSDVATMLGYDLAALSAEQATRLDIATALRLAVDDQSGKLARGETADVTRLLSASEALAKLLPPLREPPPAADGPSPQEIMWRTYKQMRDRGADVGQGYDGKVKQVEALQSEVEQLKGEIEQLKAQLAGSVPLPPNAVKLNPSPSPPSPSPNTAHVQLLPPAAAPAAPAAPRTWDDTENGRRWQEWHDAGGGGGYDRWSNRNF
jgi:hypothetical protein